MPYPEIDSSLTVATKVANKTLSPSLEEPAPKFIRELVLKCCAFESENRPDFAKVIEYLEDKETK